MSKSDKDDSKEFTFIKERILPKRKSRLKKVCVSFSFTVALAVVFGLVARVAFIISDPLICRILGIDTNKKQVVLSAGTANSSEIGSTMAPEQDNKKDTNNLVASEENQDKSITENETITTTPSKEQEKQGEGESKTVNNTYYVENSISATAKDFCSMYADLKKIAYNSMRSLVTITRTVTDVDALNNPYDINSHVPGLIVGSNGVEYLILVDYKGVKDAAFLTATFPGNTRVAAKLQSFDKDTNLAILSVRLDELSEYAIEESKIVTLGDSNILTNGTPIMAIGSPNGLNQSMDIGMVTNSSGVVYVTDQRIDLFYTSITYANNGLGFIIDCDGDVVGIITNEFRTDEEERISTAIGISKVKRLIERLVNKQSRVYLGIVAEDMPADQLADAGLTVGVYVSEVVANSPAYDAGIQSGDIIVTIDEKLTSGTNGYAGILEGLNYKDEVPVQVVRYNNGKTKEIKLKLVVGKRG